MSEPKLERLSEEELTVVESTWAPWDGNRSRLVMSLVAEVRATRLSAEDVKSLHWARSIVSIAINRSARIQSPFADEKENDAKCLALLDRLIGRSAP